MFAGWSSNERLGLGGAKSGVSSAYSNTGSILDDYQSIRSVMILGSSLTPPRKISMSCYR